MRVIKYFSVLMVFAILVSCNTKGQTKEPLKTELDSISYALGLDMSLKLKANFEEADHDYFLQGIHSGLDSANILIEPRKIDSILRAYFQKRQFEIRKKQEEERLRKAEEEFGHVKEEGMKFLEENKSKEGVQTTESGLQYIVLKEGSGESPTSTSRVKVHYHGTLLDGTVFDSSVEKGEPSMFYANQVIRGWTEGLQLMKVGSKFKFFIPQELAYGASPRQGGKIRPFDALIFEVELLEIVKL